jgi:hypothetical protein
VPVSASAPEVVVAAEEVAAVPVSLSARVAVAGVEVAAVEVVSVWGLPSIDMQAHRRSKRR